MGGEENKRLGLVQNTGHASLLAVGSVLGDNALGGSLVNSGGRGDHGLNGSVGVELLQSGLGGGLHHLVAESLVLGNGDALDSRLNVRHLGIHLLRCIQIISMDYCITFMTELQAEFGTFFKFLRIPGKKIPCRGETSVLRAIQSRGINRI